MPQPDQKPGSDSALKPLPVSRQTPSSAGRPRVVIIGAGFAGLNAAKSLARKDVEVFIVDRKNHHTFQPLLYQVAMAVLSPAEIATPIRTIFRGRNNVKVFLGTASGFDLEKQFVHFKDTDVTLHYDYLIVAAGAGHTYFGHNDWAPLAPGLKTIEDALEIRRRVLDAFEYAERLAATRQGQSPRANGAAETPRNVAAELPAPNFVIIGAGPTGVELAGAMADIARKVLVKDFRYIDPRKSRVIVLEGGPRVLAAYPEDLSASAQKQLEELGVEVRTNTRVTGVEKDSVHIGDEVLPAAVIMWAAGVAASPLGKMLADAAKGAGPGTGPNPGEVKTDKHGRVIVEKDLTIAGRPNVFVVGDLAAAYDDDGNMVPGVAPAAIQMGHFAATQVLADFKHKPRKPFHYWDKGSLATIGRSRAVGAIGKLHLSGLIAWLGWLFIHLTYLIGFRNRFFVMLEWSWTYFSYQQGARLITDKE
jgi:NADH:ubiquinone reductase (H+-translocating)